MRTEIRTVKRSIKINYTLKPINCQHICVCPAWICTGYFFVPSMPFGTLELKNRVSVPFYTPLEQ